MVREGGPARYARDPLAGDLAIPRLVEEEDPHARLREGLRDDDVVLAERVELELLRETHLVIGGARRVVAAARVFRAEVAHGLQVDSLRVVEDALFAEPRLRDVAAAFRARGDEVELVARGDEALEDDGAVLVDLELREELAVVEADPELIALLGAHALEARYDRVVGSPTLLLREKVPADLALIRELHVELLREPAEIRNGADRHDVVEVDAELHGTGRSIQRPTRMTALKTQCAAILDASVPVARRNPAMMTPPTKTTTSAPTAAGMTRTTGMVVFTTVNHATVPCQRPNAIADTVIAVRTRDLASSPPSSVPRKASSSGITAPSGR